MGLIKSVLRQSVGINKNGAYESDEQKRRTA